jgi:hypothetical protein
MVVSESRVQFFFLKNLLASKLIDGIKIDL